MTRHDCPSGAIYGFSLASAAVQTNRELPVAAKPPAGATAARAVSWQSMEQTDARRAWDALAAQASEPNPYFESWYLLPALRALDPHGKVRLLKVESGNELIGLIPVHADQRYYGRPIPNLAGWTHGNCFLGAPLVAKGHEPHFWRALLDWADAQGQCALFLHLSALPLDGPLHAGLQAVMAEQGRLSGLVHREERAMLASDLSPEAYFEASLSGKKRKELRRQFARLSELGAVTFERSRNDDGIADWCSEFLALEHSGWKGTAGSALASHQTTMQLFREALAGAAAQGRLERLTLRLDGEPLAMLVNFLTAPGAYSYKTAFDERYARYSPGVLVQRENLDLLGDAAIDWCDSCAAADHPMIDHIWRERRAVGRISIAIGGKLRRSLFSVLLGLELGRRPIPAGKI